VCVPLLAPPLLSAASAAGCGHSTCCCRIEKRSVRPRSAAGSGARPLPLLGSMDVCPSHASDADVPAAAATACCRWWAVGCAALRCAAHAWRARQAPASWCSPPAASPQHARAPARGTHPHAHTHTWCRLRQQLPHVHRARSVCWRRHPALALAGVNLYMCGHARTQALSRHALACRAAAATRVATSPPPLVAGGRRTPHVHRAINTCMLPIQLSTPPASAPLSSPKRPWRPSLQGAASDRLPAAPCTSMLRGCGWPAAMAMHRTRQMMQWLRGRAESGTHQETCHEACAQHTRPLQQHPPLKPSCFSSVTSPQPCHRERCALPSAASAFHRQSKQAHNSEAGMRGAHGSCGGAWMRTTAARCTHTRAQPPLPQRAGVQQLCKTGLGDVSSNHAVAQGGDDPCAAHRCCPPTPLGQRPQRAAAPCTCTCAGHAMSSHAWNLRRTH
jgi:hypothetical protein